MVRGFSPGTNCQLVQIVQGLTLWFEITEIVQTYHYDMNGWQHVHFLNRGCIILEVDLTLQRVWRNIFTSPFIYVPYVCASF